MNKSPGMKKSHTGHGQKFRERSGTVKFGADQL